MTDEELIAKWIEPNPHKPWAEEAVVRGTLIPVWSLVGYRDAYDGDLSRVAAAFRLPLAAVEAAMAYYAAHQCIIDNRIAANAV